jgi:membrane fusion protein (multidrug efflux system)
VQEVFFEDGDRVRTGQVPLQMRDGGRPSARSGGGADATEDEYARTTLAAKTPVGGRARSRRTAEAARARRDLAEVELDRMTIRAPFDGVLGAREVSPGDRVSKSTALIRIDAVDRLRLRFSVPELAVTAMRVGSPVVVSVAPFPGEHFAGQVYFVAPTLDPASRRLQLKGVANGDRRLRPGLFATSSSRWRGATTRSSFPSRRSRTTPTASSSGASARARPPSGSR